MNSIYHVRYYVRNSFDKYLMMGDELIPKRGPNTTQKLVTINDLYDVKYSIRNSLDKLERE